MGLFTQMGGTIGKKVNPTAPQTDNKESILTWIDTNISNLSAKSDLSKEYHKNKKTGADIAKICMWNYSEKKNQTCYFLKCRNRKLYEYDPNSSVKDYKSSEAWYDHTTKEQVLTHMKALRDAIDKCSDLSELGLCYIKDDTEIVKLTN